MNAQKIKLLLIIFAAGALLSLIYYCTFPLPPELKDKTSVQSFQITDRNGVPLREILSSNEGRGRWRGFSEISPRLIDATIVAEDARFYWHRGIDPIAIFRALLSNIRERKIVSGGSTITQQLARIIRPSKRTLSSKIYEALIALRIEMSLSKKEILEQYLNRAPYGNQLFGIEAASQMYFGKPARDLAIAEAAFLAILPRAPSAFDPYRHPEKIKRIHRALIEDLHRHGKITGTELEITLKTPLKLIPRRWAWHAPHFVEMFAPARHFCESRNPVATPSLSRGKQSRVLKTSLDIKLQSRIERIVDANLKALERYNVTNAAVVVVDNQTGEILALVGSRDYFDEETAGNVNGATSRRQPGSTPKPFTYALALDSGYTAASIIPDIEIQFPTEGGDYSPKNYDLRHRGPVRLRTALANSLNVPAVYLLSQLGTERLLSRLHRLHFESLDRESSHYGLGLTLGNGEVTLLELAAGYSALARGGVYLPLSPLPVKNVPEGERVFSEETAYLIADIMSDDETRRMSFGEDTPLNLPFRVAAKTGTTKNFRDNWTVGFTPEITVAVWVGNFDASPMRGVSGITGAGPIFKDVFLAAAKDKKMTWFAPPKNIVHKTVCPLSGMLIAEGATGIDEIFVSGTEPKERCTFHVERLVDIRNDLLALESCGKWAVKRSFVHLPERYHDWARTHNIPLPPREYSPYCRPSGNAEVEKAASRDKKPIFKITHPNNKSVYSIDPYIPRRLQTLYLKASADEPVKWFIDGRELATTTSPHSISWPLTEGRHEINISSRDGDLGDKIEITVYK